MRGSGSQSAKSAKPPTVQKPAPKKQKPAAKLPVETFANLPFVDEAKLSPDGSHIAGIFGVKGEQRIVITPRSGDRSQTVMLAVPDLTEVSFVRWVNDDNIVMGVYGLVRVSGADDPWYVSRLVGINRITKKVIKLLPKAGGQNASDILHITPDGSDEILVAAQDTIYSNREGFYPSVYRINVSTGKKRRIVSEKVGVLDWGADSSGTVRYGISYQDRNQTSRLYYRREGAKSFRTIESVDLNDGNLKVPFLFVPGTDNAYIIKDNAEGKTVIAEVNLATQQDVRTVYEHKDGDVTSAILSFDGTKLLGVRTDGKGKKLHWLDPAVAKAQDDLNTAVKNANVRIESFSRDQSKMMVRISSPDNPGLIYYYDAKSQGLAKFTDVNGVIKNKRLAKAKKIQYDARDGLEIEGILTLPKGRLAKDLPFIVMPHGGPWAHDRLRYDYWAQFLANRGYAVLQPNFRGSTGYGKEFLEAGKGQMGFAMQDDITDGVNWAVKKGIADPKRVCIVGASYGGYAAMWGIVKDPDQYRCSISIAGVSSLRKEVNDFGGSIRRKLYRNQWREMTPNFKAVSPINSIDKIKTPLLLIHGKKDVTVDHSQSVKMSKAMAKAGKPVEFVSIPLADHHFTRQEDRLTLLKSMEAFLAKHNPAD